MNVRTILIGLMLITLAMAPQASAGKGDQTSCEEDPNQERCTTPEDYCSERKDPEKCEEKIREKCAQNPDARTCSRFLFETLCKTVIIHSGSPQIGTWDPILGLIEIHEDTCYDYYREAHDGALIYLFTYEEVDGMPTVHRDNE